MAILQQRTALRILTVLILALVITGSMGQEEGWGMWNDYTECSRSCGGGVQQSSRQCLFARPGSSKCQGQSVQYQSCNVKACPAGSPEFRSSQCSSYNTVSTQLLLAWSPYYDPSSPCALICRNEAGHIQRLRETVIDGTTCDNGDTFGLCISGVCKPVGCDHILGSVKAEDKCLVCGGTGENCQTVTGTTMDKTLRADEQTEVTTLPVGATKVTISLASPSPSALELKSESGRSLQLSEAPISFGQRKITEYAGTHFSFKFLEDGMTFSARGPLNETLQLLVRFQGLSPLVDYEYSISKSRVIEERPSPDQRYAWIYGGWTSCSQECGPGYQLRQVTCMDRERGQSVSDQLCPRAQLPDKNQTCNLGPCQNSLADGYKWVPGHWAECSVDCGLGEQTQLMHCIETGLSGDSGYSSDELCSRYAGPKPRYSKACYGESDQCPYWATGSWSECSVTCGYGRETRSVYCQRDPADQSKDPVVLDNDQCTHETRPERMRQCTRLSCTDGSNSEILPLERLTTGSHCKESRFGCCPDDVTPAKGDGYAGCVDYLVETGDPCEAPSDRGPCANYTIKWYFDTKENDCLRFWYGGCEGNRNRYDDRDSCRNTCLKKSLKPVGCASSHYGCCQDGVTYARGANRDGCPETNRIGGCAGTQHGCCQDGVTSARGPNREGCPDTRLVGGCAGTRYGCCQDGVTSARAPNREGCSETRLVGGCAGTRYGCCADRLTAASGPNRQGCPELATRVVIGGCQGTRYGCCADGVTAARGDNRLGCAENPFMSCQTTQYGCCEDGTTASSGPDGAGCPERKDLVLNSCQSSRYGCCPDGVTAAQGLNEEGCPSFDHASCSLPKDAGTCTDYTLHWHFETTYGMCRQFWFGGCGGNQNKFSSKEECEAKCVEVKGSDVCRLPSVSGPCKAAKRRYFFNTETGKCESFIYGGCKGNTNNFHTLGECQASCNGAVNTQAGTSSSCERSVFGCCPDGQSAARGPDYEGCQQSCENSRYGCCPDGLKSAEGPDYEGCELGSGVVPCEATEFGCCPDGTTAAAGPRGRGCEDITDSEDGHSSGGHGSSADSVVVTNTRTEKCKAPAPRELCTEYVIRWRYDETKQVCERHWWGGCADNGNVFDSQESCEAECVETAVITDTDMEDPDFVNICDMAADVGPCRGRLPRYFYNGRERNCGLFYYGGCRGNENNFQSLEECQRECMGGVVREEVTTTTQAPVTIAPPQQGITLSMSGNSVVQENSEIKLSCNAVGPVQVTLEWFINGQAVSGQDANIELAGRSSVSTDGSRQIYQQVAELIIRSARSENSGTYYCRSSSGELERMVISVRPSAEVRTTTEAPAEVDSSISMSGESMVELGATVTVTCRAVGSRRPSDIEWFINGRIVSDDQASLSIKSYPDPRALNALISELSINKADADHAGTFYCRSRPYGDLDKMLISVEERKEMTTQTPASDDPAAVCVTDFEAGNCYASIPRWYYDYHDGACQQFTYGGCGGNNNNFETEQQCNDYCSAQVVCLLPKLIGRCRAAMTRFYFDSQTGTCQEFVYGGCDGNLNNFATMEACNQKCAEYRRRGTGVDVEVNSGGEVKGWEVCQLNPDKGSCRGYEIKWYYSPARERCSRFVYTGCDGNGNRFDSEDLCMNTCVRNEVIDERPTYRPIPTTTTPTTTSTELSGSVCSLAKSAGDCADYTILWYYDTERQRCLRFYYGGCGGNGNRFDNEEDCQHTCVYGEATTPRPAVQTDRPVSCYYSRYGCCDDGVTAAADSSKSNCEESNVIVQPGGDHTVILVRPGADATLKCSLRGQYVLWYRDGFLLSSSQRFQSLANGTLVLRDVSEDMAGFYACRTSNGNAIPQLEKFKIEVNVPLSILPGPALMSIKPGESAFMHCQAVGNPLPRLSWQRNGQVLRSNGHFRVFGNGTLIIDRVQVNDAGTYECTAENGVAPTVRRRIDLNIKETIEADIQRHQGIYMEGDTIQLSCRGTGYPPPSVEWFKEGTPLKTEGKYVVRGGELSINSASIDEAGMYKCVASNNRDTVEDVTTIQIKFHSPQTKCEDSMQRTKCHLIVAGRLCGFRIFATKCCQSCRRAGFL